MWKCARKSLKATFRNGVLRCNTVLSTKARNNKESPAGQNCFLQLTPAVLEHYKNFYNLCRKSSGNFSSEKKESEEPKEKTRFFDVFHNHLFFALKWSFILTAGYGYLQYKLKTWDWNETRLLRSTKGYHKTLGYLINAVGLQPYHCVFPEVQATKSKNGGQEFTDYVTKNFKADENFSRFEKALQEAIGTLNNKLGIQCIKSGKYKEAVDYFIQSAEGEYAPGIFNLGICHLKGLGTTQNFQKAKELYQKAADLGHATAMYNLGVFYAQGKGGIQVDLDRAQELFTAAAKLGQADAIKALELEEEAKCLDNDLVFNERKENIFNQLISYELTDKSSSSSSQELFNDIKSSCDSLQYSEEEELNSLLGSDSGVLDLSPHSEPYPLFN